LDKLFDERFFAVTEIEKLVKVLPIIGVFENTLLLHPSIEDMVKLTLDEGEFPIHNLNYFMNQITPRVTLGVICG
jgi:hypothetical protein